MIRATAAARLAGLAAARLAGTLRFNLGCVRKYLLKIRMSSARANKFPLAARLDRFLTRFGLLRGGIFLLRINIFSGASIER